MKEKLRLFDVSELFTLQGNKANIGCGTFANVIFCKNSKSEKFAVKCYTISGSVEDMKRKEQKSKVEAEILLKVAHSNIMKVFGIVIWNGYMGIVTEYLSGGNLDELLRSESLKNIPWGLRLRMALQLSEAISHLHNYKSTKSLIHGDIKPENILLTKDLVLKLSDFGSINMVKCTGASRTTTTLPVTRQHTQYYLAPEYLKNLLMEPETKRDLFSFGVVLYELITRERPFEKASVPPHIIINAIIYRNQRPDQRYLEEIKKNLTSDDLQIFNLLDQQMRLCWSQEPNARPDMATVVNILRSQFNLNDDEIVKQQIKDVVEQMDRIEKDFDISNGITLSFLSIHSDDELNDKQIKKRLDNFKVSKIASNEEHSTSGLKKIEKRFSSKLSKHASNDQSSISDLKRKEIVEQFISELSENASEVKPSKSALNRKGDCDEIDRQTFQASSNRFRQVLFGDDVTINKIPASDSRQKNFISMTNSFETTASMENLNPQQEVFYKLQSITNFLEKNQKDEAVKQCEELIQISVESITFGYSVIIEEIFKIFKQLKEKLPLIKVTQVIQWALDLCLKIYESDIKQVILDILTTILGQVEIMMFKNDQRVNIARHTLPIRLKIHKVIQSSEITNLKNNELIKAKSFYYLAGSYNYIGESTLALETFQLTVEKMTSSLRDDAKKYHLLALCYESMSGITASQGKITLAFEYCKQSIELYQSVEDITQETKEQRITYLRQILAQLSIK